MPLDDGKELYLNDESFERVLDQRNIDTFLDEIAQKNAPVAQMFVGFYKYCSKHNYEEFWTKFVNLLDTDDIKSFDMILKALISDGKTYSAALRFMFDKIATFRITSERLGDFIAQKITSKDNDRMAAFIAELNQLMDLNYRFNPIMVNAMMQHGMDKYEVRFHELVSKRVLKKDHSDIGAIDADFLAKFCHYRSMLLGRSLIKRRL